MAMSFSTRLALLLGGTVCVGVACGGDLVDSRGYGVGAADAGSPCANPITVTDCTMCASGMACESCVRRVDSAGSEVSDQMTIKDCGCAAGSMCNKAGACLGDPACPSGTTPPTSECYACLVGVMGGDPCTTPYLADCEANADCKQYLFDVQPCLTLQ
jgi:hypothetical protein